MRTFIAAALIAFACGAFGQADPAVLAQARAHKEPLLDTLKDLVAIESNSRDFEGLERIANLIAERLKKLGVKVVEGVDKSGFEKAAQPIQDSLAKELGPHAVKILELVRNVK